MDKRYEVYSLADRHFYETPDRLSAASSGAVRLFGAATREVPAGWCGSRSGDWYHLHPVDSSGSPHGGRPLQGWKVHVSATLDNADKTAGLVWDYCVPREMPFKFVPAPHLLHLRNSKYAARDGSGKFATLYPVDEAQLHTVLTQLGDLLAGQEGPYILTDLRWREGPLYVRYGAFARRFCLNARGSLVSAVQDPQGQLVPDLRDPAFQTPSWVTLPAFLEPQLAARNATTVGDLPYRIEKAMHFSNGGGVYQGTDTRDGRKVVLKEGRPHAGLAADGADAVTRLEREKRALEQLSGLGVAPQVRDWFTLGGHRFLVMDFVEGATLNSFFARRHPLLTSDPDPGKLEQYTTWALRIHRAVEEAVAAVHGRGWVFNDLHMFNIMVSPDESSVSLIDFEAAAPAEERGRQVMAHPGFLAPADRRGVDVDRYALACLRLALFLPSTTLFAVDPGKASHLAEVIADQFPVPRAFLDAAVREITGETRSRPASGKPVRTQPADLGDWPTARESMVRALLVSATPDRDDRLFPGDIGQFAHGGSLGLEFGAAGVLYALAATGTQRYEEGERWLLRHTDPPPGGTPLGLYDGLAGVAYVLAQLGHTQRAMELADILLAEQWQRLGSDLRGGLSGIALALDDLANTTGASTLRARADEATGLLAERIKRLAGGEADNRSRERRAGLMHGATGPALLFVRRYQDTGDPALLDRAAQALRLDLDQCVWRDNGALAVDEGWRTMPYAGDGSVGIGMVLDEYLRHRPDPDFETARQGIAAAARSRFYAQPGLLQGRAGMVLHLSRTTTPGVRPEHVAAQIEGLAWHQMSYQGELAFPGNQMMRLSMDLATGTAGCLLALGAALGEKPASLPFLPPLRPHARPRTRGAVVHHQPVPTKGTDHGTA
ncbi:class III lanthionine synthetase LanKC [Kitasatospora sp. NPDC101235]|uniref:class III lanthionine synthetase LanKC n=1 Tax=Kitasatospora sp. NPDC101235 TaxID=3364101 RepID=UPI0038263A17